MKAFTIATADVVPLSAECEQRVKKFCGVDEFELVIATDRADAYHKKLTQWLTYREPVWFIDSDMWFIRYARFPTPSGPMIIGAPANTPNPNDPKGENFDMKMALCSSLTGMDMGNQECRDIVSDAIYLQEERYAGHPPATDGWFLNIAAQRNYRIMICRLSSLWNWCSAPVPQFARNIHAAGRENKLEWLKANTIPI